MTVRIDTDLCTACGLCVDDVPDVFKMGEEGIAHTIVDEVPPDVEDQAREAAESCPVDAISIEE